MESSSMSPEDAYNGLRTVKQGLEVLQNDFEAVHLATEKTLKGLSADAAPLAREKYSQTSENRQSVISAAEEVQTMLTVLSILQNMDMEKQKLEFRLRTMTQENAWLKEELFTVREQLQEASRQVGKLEEETKDLKYQNSMKTFEQNLESNGKMIEPSVPLSTQDTLQDLGFGPEEDDMITSSDALPAPVQPSTASAIDELPEKLKAVHSVINKYAAAGRPEVAIPLCKKAIEDLEKTNGHDHQDVATMLNILSQLYRDQNKLKEALSLLNEVLSIREKVLGDSHLAVASTLSNLSILHGKRGNFQDAESFAKRALQIKEKNLGPDNMDVAKQLNNLALLLIGQNTEKHEEAEQCYKRALDIYESKLGQDDPNVVKTKNNLASAYMKQGKLKEAEELYKQILNRAHEREYGRITQANKAIWQVAEEREAEKQKSGHSTAGDQAGIRIPKVDSPAVASTLKKLSELYRKQGKYEAAEILDDVALRAKKQSSRVMEKSVA